jgi:quercetin dioxygenase-like cupin family protein
MERPASRPTASAPAPRPEATLKAPIVRRGLLGGAMAASAASVLAPVAGPSAQAAGLSLRPNPADELIRLGPLAVRFLLTGESSGGTVAAFEVTVPGAQRLAAPAHSHDAYEETIYGVTGVLTWTVEGRKIDVGPGQALCIPRGAVHRFDNNTSAEVRQLCVITPAVLGPAYFREAAALINASAGGPPDVARMIEVMRRHGITPARP